MPAPRLRRKSRRVDKFMPAHRLKEHRLATTETNKTPDCDEHRSDMISGKGTAPAWRVAQESMQKAKDAVCDQVNMEVLAGEDLSASPEEQHNQHNRIENYFGRYCRPARDT